MRKLSKEQRMIIAMGALVWAGVYLADFNLLWLAMACFGPALVLSVYLLLQNVQITIGRFIIGSPGTPRSR